MRILAIGDVFGKSGCDFLLKNLPTIKKENSIDLIIANGENSAEGNGILPTSAEMLFTAGVDVITGGNHSLRRREIYNMLDENAFLLRPANFPKSVPGNRPPHSADKRSWTHQIAYHHTFRYTHPYPLFY